MIRQSISLSIGVMLVAMTCQAQVADEKAGAQQSEAISPTPSGLDTVRPGDDITDELQWALDHQHECLQPIVIPPGNFVISKTIELPYRSGWHLEGSGLGIVGNHPQLTGRRTMLQWKGEPDGTMFMVTGTFGTFGNMTLKGSGTAVLVDFPSGKDGLGVGKMIFKPLWLERFATGVQVGSSSKTLNCDNLYFEWLEARHCQVVYHGVNLQGMDIVFNHFRNFENKVGLLFDGGGQVHVRSSLTTKPSTLLKINDTKGRGVGINNGFFRLSQTKVDNQAGGGFVMVDCAESDQVDILVDGGIQSGWATGTFAKLTGKNKLVVRDYRSTFQGIEGTVGRGQRPTVLLDGCRCWKMPEFIGVSGRLSNCVDGNGQWIDDQG